MTVAAMRAAVLAIRAGVFDDVGDGHLVRDDRSSSAAVTGPAHRPERDHLPWTGAGVGGRVLLVLAGHAGAGASTVAVAVAEGLASGRPVELIEYARPTRSGLISASTIELGVDGAWRRGRRGRVDVLRLARPAADELPAPPEADGRERLLVVDAGWALTTALLEGPPSFGSGDLVVVTRVTVPALRQTEHTLAALGADAWVAAVGPSRWPRAVEAGVGSHLGRLRSRGRVVRVPLDARLEVTGLTGDRLPRSVAAAGRSLADRIVPPGPSRHRRRAAPARVARAEDTR